MQLELITAEGCATVRENVGEGLLSAAYYVEWWSRRIAEHTTEQQHAASRRAYAHSPNDLLPERKHLYILELKECVLWGAGRWRASCGSAAGAQRARATRKSSP